MSYSWIDARDEEQPLLERLLARLRGREEPTPERSPLAWKPEAPLEHDLPGEQHFRVL